MKNEKTQPVWGHTAIRFNSPHLQLLVRRKNGKNKKIEALSLLQGMVAVIPHVIEPGESHEAKEVLTLDLDRVFPEPGDYQLQAVLTGSPGEIKSNVVNIHISEPEGLDLAAYQNIKQKGEYAFILSGGDLSDRDKARRDLEEFASLYEHSVYGDYAVFLLGSSYLADKEFTKAEQQFRKVASKSNFIYADEAKGFIDKIKKKLLDLSVANKP